MSKKVIDFNFFQNLACDTCGLYKCGMCIKIEKECVIWKNLEDVKEQVEEKR